jgi:hypothetical protein
MDQLQQGKGEVTDLEEAVPVRKGRRGAGCATRVVEEATVWVEEWATVGGGRKGAGWVDRVVVVPTQGRRMKR